MGILTQADLRKWREKRVKRLASTAFLVGVLVLMGCGGSASDGPAGAEALSQPSRGTSQELAPEDQRAEFEADSTANPAADFNSRWVALIDAQKAWEGMAAVPEIQTGEVGPEWIFETGRKLKSVRSAYDALNAEAQALDLPATFTTKGEISRPTVDEYMSSYGAYLEIQEEAQAIFERCAEEGGSVLTCSLEGTAILGESDLPAVLERLRMATLKMYEEANQPTS